MPDVTAAPMELDSVSFSFESEAVLRRVSLVVQPRDFMILIGPNGAGKTTLLKVALGLLGPSEGAALLFGRPASDSYGREQTGYVPQRAAISPRVPATVAEVVLAGRAGRRWSGPSSKEDRAATAGALEKVGLASLARRRVGELSGGQQQRVLVARALANEPGLLILDEPTAGIDRDSHLRFASVLRDLNRSGVTIVVVAHDLGALGRDVTRVLALHQGHIDEISPEKAREQVGLFVEDHHR
jgi:zinc transport system ATP-binding protein